MAYRTYVGTTGKDSIQILGNNEFYQPFIDELIKQGIEVDEDSCYGLEESGAIQDIQPFIDILEQYILDKDEKLKKIFKKDIFNLRPEPPEQEKDFTFRMRELKENGYIFVTANLIDYLEDEIENINKAESHLYQNRIPKYFELVIVEGEKNATKEILQRFKEIIGVSNDY